MKKKSDNKFVLGKKPSFFRSREIMNEKFIENKFKQLNFKIQNNIFYFMTF
jgi:hypothetical protein